MKKTFLFLIVFLSIQVFSQSLVQTVTLPVGSYWNSGYGLVFSEGKYWISSGSSTAGKGLLYAVNANGEVVDTLQITYPGIRESQGLAFDGTNFWYVERKTSKCDLYKVSQEGTVLDSIILSSINGGTSWYVGGAGWDGSGVWVSVYSPDAQAALYKIDVSTKTIVDTISVYGLQPQGITVKGDTLFYVMDGFQSDPENIYAVNLNTEDTLFSFHVPEQIGLRQNPRGLAWDGSNFWLMAEPVGASSGRNLFKFDLGGSGTPSIQMLTTTIDFGNVQIDSTKLSWINIKNYGTADLIIDSIYISSSAFDLLNSLPVTIKPDSIKTLEITFTPAAYTSYYDSIMFFHNDPNFLYSRTKLLGNGVYTAAYLGLSSSSINFYNKRVNSASYIELTFTNYGSAPLLIDSVKLSTSRFYIQDLTLPLLLDSVSAKTFKIWFNPNAITNYSDALQVYSNASNGSLINIPLAGSGTAFDATLGNIIWQGNIPDNPNTSYNEYQVDVITNIEDISGDGIEDVIVATENYYVIAFNGNSSVSSDILWKFNTYQSSYSAGPVQWVQNLKIAPDINGDGYDDVIAGTTGGGESVYAISGLTGEKIWEYGDSVNYGLGDIMGVDCKRDFNNDGIVDVAATQSGNEFNGEGLFSVFLFNGLNGNIMWQINQSAQQKLKYDIVTTTCGGAFGTRVGTLYEVSGFDPSGNIMWTVNPSGTPWALDEIENVGGDQNTDVIVGTITGNVYALSGINGAQIWQAYIGNVFIEDLRVIEDVNNSGKQDILVSGIAPYVYVLEGSTGAVIWSMPVAGNILGIGELGDITGDAINDIGVADLGNQLAIFGSTQGTTLFTYMFGTGSTSTAAEQVARMGEVDNVGAGEFIAGSRNGKVIAFSGGPDGIVPVELNTFNASVNGTNVILNWTTATEVNNKGFSVERKSENGEYEQIAFINGSGTTTEPSGYAYTDKELPYGKFFYRLRQIDFDGTYKVYNAIEVNIGLPFKYSLEQNYPNPFNPSTIIKYALPYDGIVKLKIYNTIGEEIAVLVNGLNKAGHYQIEWKGTNGSGVKVPSGVYIYRLETDKFVDVKKMMMIK